MVDIISICLQRTALAGTLAPIEANYLRSLFDNLACIPTAAVYLQRANRGAIDTLFCHSPSTKEQQTGGTTTMSLRARTPGDGMDGHVKAQSPKLRAGKDRHIGISAPIRPVLQQDNGVSVIQTG